MSSQTELQKLAATLKRAIDDYSGNGTLGTGANMDLSGIHRNLEKIANAVPKFEVIPAPDGEKTVYVNGLHVFARCGHIVIADDDKFCDIEKDSKTEEFLLRYLEKNPQFKGIDDKFGI